MKVVLSPPETLAIFTSKVNMQLALEAAGLPVAPRVRSGKAVFKPEFGRGGRGIVKLDLGPTDKTDDELDAIAKMLGCAGRYIFQKDLGA